MTSWLSALRTRYRSLTGSVPHDIPRWLADLPASILFVDVQTTGLSAADRVTTFGAVRLTTAPLQDGVFELETAHLIFNPRRMSFARAEQIHGYSDWILRHQDKFYLHAERIEDLLESSDLIVIHNAEFGLGFLNRELALDGRHPIWRPTFCTMKACQRSRRRGGASLADIGRQLGLPLPSQQPSALENAWTVMLAYLWLSQCPYRPDAPDDVLTSPSNLKAPPRLPASLMPRNHSGPDRLQRKPAASIEAGPLQLAGRPVAPRAKPVPAARPAPQPIHVPVVAAADTAVTSRPIEIPVQTALAETASSSPPDAITPLPANDLRTCVDEVPAITVADAAVELPEVLMPETAAAASPMPPDAVLHSPPDLILPVLALDVERPERQPEQEVA